MDVGLELEGLDIWKHSCLPVSFQCFLKLHCFLRESRNKIPGRILLVLSCSEFGLFPHKILFGTALASLLLLLKVYWDIVSLTYNLQLMASAHISNNCLFFLMCLILHALSYLYQFCSPQKAFPLLCILLYLVYSAATFITVALLLCVLWVLEN